MHFFFIIQMSEYGRVGYITLEVDLGCFVTELRKRHELVGEELAVLHDHIENMSKC